MPSTVIDTIAYRAGARELEIRFTTGRRYLFRDVPPEAAEAFRRARIKGRHFNARIRGRYAFTEIDDAAGLDGWDGDPEPVAGPRTPPPRPREEARGRLRRSASAVRPPR
jgi:hypothetical protein